MPKGASAAIEHLINEEIRRLVVTAMAGKAALSADECVAHLKAAFPTCRISTREIADKVQVVASAAGLSIELGGQEKRTNRRGLKPRNS